MPAPLTILMDNGSLEPAATLGLRELAAQLAERIGEPVAPISLLHSSGVPAEKIGGVLAEILEPALERRLAAGQSDFIIVPLFFGPSGALTDYLPKRIAQLRAKHPALNITLAAPLFERGDDRLARILAEQVKVVGARLARARAGVDEPRPYKDEVNLRIILVDHGSPARAVVDVRNELARQLASQLGPGHTVTPASMERRDGAEYDFCEPLLERLLREPGWNSGEVILAMQFLLPGRHAGPHGDVARLGRAAETASGGALRIHMTALVAGHPLLIDILADRWRRAC